MDSITQELDWRDYDNDDISDDEDYNLQESTLPNASEQSNIETSQNTDQQSGDQDINRSMSVADVALYLKEHGIPPQYYSKMLIIFLDNYIDGMEFFSLKESDVKAMVPPIGLTKKIMRLLPKRYNVSSYCNSILKHSTVLESGTHFLVLVFLRLILSILYYLHLQVGPVLLHSILLHLQAVTIVIILIFLITGVQRLNNVLQINAYQIVLVMKLYEF